MNETSTTAQQPTAIQTKGMNAVVLTQCVGVLSFVILGNNMLFLYLTKLGVGSAGVLLYLALPNLAGALLSIPTAFFSDRYGKKKIGVPGMIIAFISSSFKVYSEALLPCFFMFIHIHLDCVY